MCGIYALLSKKTGGLFHHHLDTAYTMSIITQLRGSQSSGVFFVTSAGNSKILRCLNGPLPLFASKEGKEYITHAIRESCVFVGHGRFATKGGISVENAHPFREKHISIVHNGTIHGGLEAVKDVEVDSHALAHLIAEKGITELKNVKGAYAIIAHDSKENCLWIARNELRPLHWVEDNEIIYIMSDPVDLTYLKTKEKINGEIKQFDACKVYKFCLTTKKLTEEMDVTPPILQLSYWKEDDYTVYNGKPKYNVYSTKSKEVLLATNKKDLLFTVNKVEKTGARCHRYTGVSEDGTKIMFFADKDHGYVGKLGLADVHFEQVKDGEKQYIIKHRNIVWDSEQETKEKATPDEMVKTYDGTRISKHRLAEMAKEKMCVSCNSEVDVSDPEKIMVTNGKRLICVQCCDDYKQQTTMNKDFPTYAERILQ